MAAATLVEDYFWATRELMVLGDPYSFTCLATNIEPLAGPRASCHAMTPAGLSTGLDYVGLTCDREARLALGAVQAPGDVSA